MLVGVATTNPAEMGRPLFNSAVLLRGGEVGAAFHKTLLPTYDVFDEDRYFEPAAEPEVLELNGWRLGVSAFAKTSGTTATSGSAAAITTTRSSDLTEKGAQAIVNLSASPFTVGKQLLRERMLGQMYREIRRAAAHCEPGGRQRRSHLRRP